MGYLVGAIFAIPFVVSLALAVVGTTLAASIPSALFVGYVLYALFASAL
jgi:hypothetical protein